MRPDLIWNLANYWLRAGDDEEGLNGLPSFLHLVPHHVRGRLL